MPLRGPKQKSKLPRGLWVGKILKPKATWENPEVPEYFDSWYYRIRKTGKPQMLRSTETTSLEEATARARLAFQTVMSDKWDELRSALEGTRAKRVYATIGQWEDAFIKVAKARAIDHVRPINNMRLILAIVKGWRKPGDGKRMDANGGDIIKKVQALTADVVCEKTKLEYWRLCQGESERPNLDTKAPPEVNGTINSTLQNARVMCSKLNRQFELAGLNIPWDLVEEFVRGVLPVQDKDWGNDVPTFEAYKAMLAAADALARGLPDDKELALVNEVFRTVGLRSRELVNARESWLDEGADGRCYIWLKHRPAEGWTCKTETAGRLPLPDDLAKRLKGRCAAARAAGIVNPFLILPMVAGPEKIADKWEDPQRRALVRDRHNEWLKKFIGEVKSNQGNHRLRKYLATMLYEQHGLKIALQYLRHAKEAVAFQSYIQQREERLPIVRPEDLAAWGAVAKATDTKLPRTCRECQHCDDIHGAVDLIYCNEWEKNKHPNYARCCESFAGTLLET